MTCLAGSPYDFQKSQRLANETERPSWHDELHCLPGATHFQNDWLTRRPLQRERVNLGEAEYTLTRVTDYFIPCS